MWWPGIDRDIEALVKDCSACLVSGKTGSQAPPPLQPLAWPLGPGNTCSWTFVVKFMGFPTTNASLWLCTSYTPNGVSSPQLAL